MINYTIDVWLKHTEQENMYVRELIELVTNDYNGNVFDFVVHEDDSIFNLTGRTVKLLVKSKNGTTIMDDCTVTNATEGKASITLPADMFLEGGTYQAEVQIYQGTYRITTLPFDYTVRLSLETDESVRADNRYSILQQALQDVEDAHATATNALSTANSASTISNQAKNNADTALSNANTANTTAASALSTANSANLTANTANTTSNTANTTANQAVTTINAQITNVNNAVTQVNTLKTQLDPLVGEITNKMVIAETLPPFANRIKNTFYYHMLSDGTLDYMEDYLGNRRYFMVVENNMSHLVTDTTTNKKYRYGYQLQNGAMQLKYEEVI